jgi:hypothetical protein
MKKVLGVALLLTVADAQAQTVEAEMTKLKQLAESCIASLSTQSCDATTTCNVFKSYSRELMPDGPAGYYELHGPDKSMNPQNGKLLSEAVKAASRANKAGENCNPT